MLDLSNDETLDSQKIPIVSEIILHKRSIVGNDIKYRIRTVFGINFFNANFKSSAFFDGVITYLESVHKKKIPHTVNLVFKTRPRFSIFVGKEICENKYVSVKLIENMNLNVLEVKSIWINKTKVTETTTFLYFDMSNYEYIDLSSVYFSDFLDILKKELKNNKGGGKVRFDYAKLSTSRKKSVKIEISKNIISEVNITFKLNNAEMVFPLRALFLYKYQNEKEKKYIGYFFENENEHSEFCFYILSRCFNFYIDGDKNTIGFEKSQSAKYKCSVEYNK